MTGRPVTPQGQAVEVLLASDRTDLLRYPLHDLVPHGTLVTRQAHGLGGGVRVVAGVDLLHGFLEGAARKNPQKIKVVGHRPEPTDPSLLPHLTTNTRVGDWAATNNV